MYNTWVGESGDLNMISLVFGLFGKLFGDPGPNGEFKLLYRRFRGFMGFFRGSSTPNSLPYALC